RRRPALQKYAGKVAVATEQALDPQPTEYALTDALVRGTAFDIVAGYDPKYGGFGSSPKGLPPARLAFLLRAQARAPDPVIRRALTGTLAAMARGAVFDQLAGGFHHGCVDERWMSPRFEKRLADNAALAVVYLQAYRSFGDVEDL